MTLFPLEGRARVLGNDVSTDAIISSRRKRETIDPQVLRQYLLEDLVPSLAAPVRAGDVIVAGRNFGCGSAMEVAVTVPLAAGIRAVVAQGFARTYLRNAMNNGLLAVIADTEGIAEGDRVRLALDASGGLWLRTASGADVPCDPPIAPFMLDMLGAGGLVAYLRARRGFGV
ncbi:alpha-IPM isomerase [Verminephrobacter aporrectodeae subsp. tuberculatae]|uniref:LeuD/DmdB family oxidoreductase small subunit n=1 Tax=Verminephrobacter aporrectodeae TaxID=1110389 RepID=UPI0022443058|nr:alpha-IPM isomerase [Verminephrobacter aporrectodeae]MCW8198139.1 alpha-IPM isomerase [Verminephrobacter aporrectodeae subsp. tuberculatae]